ncbi:MAG: AsmA family protein [Planctomycetes bacterium]|nr:AsmA family protein [Planctomycetota bacterium]
MTRRRKIVLWLLGILLVLLVGGRIALGLLAPDIVRKLATQAVRDKTRMDVQMGEIQVEGLAGLSIADLRLTDTEHQGVEVAFVEQVHVTLDGIPWLWRDRIDVAEVRIVRPRVLAVREADKRLNFQRLIQPPEGAAPAEPEPAGASGGGIGRKIVVRDVRIEGADLRLLDQTVTEQPPVAETTLEGEEHQAGRLVELTGVNVHLQLVALNGMKHTFDLSFDDPNWGASRFRGNLQLEPLAVSMRTETGDVTITPENLSTLPVLPAETIRKIADAKPSARLRIREFALTDPAKLPHAVVELTDVAATAPGGGPQLRGLTTTVTVDPEKISAAVRTTLPVPLVGDIALADLQMNIGYFDKAATVNLVGASLLGGRLSGEFRVADVGRALDSLEGHLDVEGLAPPLEPLPYAAKVTGQLTLKPAADSSTGAMRVVFKGKAAGGHIEQQPIELPVEASTSIRPSQTDAPLPFDVTLGGSEDDIRLVAAGTFDRQRKTIVVTRTDGAVVFSGQLLARLANLQPKFIEQTQAEGRLRIASPGATIDLAHPNASRGRISIASDNLRMRIPGTERVEQLAFQADARSADDDPALSLIADVKVTRPESGGSVVTHVTVDRLGTQLAADVALSQLPVTRELVEEFVPRLAPEAAKHLGYLRKLAAFVYGTAKVGYDRDKKALTRLAATAKLSDLAAEVLYDMDGKPVLLPISAGSGDLAYDHATKSARASLAFDVLGGRLSVLLIDRPGDVVLQASTDDARPLRLEQLPAPLREKLPVDAAGGLALAAQTSAKSPADLARGSLGVHAQLTDGRLTTRPAKDAPARAFMAAATVDGNVDLAQKRVAGLKAQVTDLRDGQAGYLLPPGTVLNVTSRAFALNEKPGGAAVALEGPKLGRLKTTVEMDWQKRVVKAGNLQLDLILASVPWDQMATQIRQRAAKLLPQGRIATAAGKDCWVSYAMDGGEVACDLALDAKDLSWLQPTDQADATKSTRVAPMDIQATVSRADAAQPYNVHVWTNDPDYGELDATALYATDDVSFTARMKETTLQPALLALAGGKVGELEEKFNVSGVFSMQDVRGRLTRGTDNSWWPPAELGGAINVRNLSLDALDGNLPLRSAAAAIELSKDKIVLKELTGLLAEGKLAVAAEVSLLGEMPFKGTLALERLDVRRLAAVAHLPPNELKGRLTIRDFAFSGLAGPKPAPGAVQDKAGLAIANTLEGKGHASFGEGYLWQLPLLKVVRTGLFDGIAGFLRGKFDPTSFRTAEADFEFMPMAKVTAPHPAGGGRKSGLIRFPDVRIDSDLIRMVIDGDVYWDDWLDMHVAASVIGEKTAVDRLGGLGDLLGGDVKKAADLLKKLPTGGLPILGSFYHITGPFQNPQRSVDTQRAWQSLSGSATDFLHRKDKTTEQPGDGQQPQQP